MSHSNEIALGHYAETLLNNPAYQHALVQMKADLFEEFSSIGWNARRKRKDLHVRIQCVLNLERKIESMMSNGKALENVLNREEARANKLAERSNRVKSVR
jgi:hypothetical protein